MGALKTRTGRRHEGKFDVKPGMVFHCFDMADINNNTKFMKAGTHPWLVLDVKDDYVITVMCGTKRCDAERKDREKRQDFFDNRLSIEKPNPPMADNEYRQQTVAMETCMVIPKKFLFEHTSSLYCQASPSCSFKTHNESVFLMDKDEVARIKNKTQAYISENIKNRMLSVKSYDPFHISQDQVLLKKGIMKPEKFEEKHGWKHLPDADPSLLYPSESHLAYKERKNYSVMSIIDPETYPPRDRGQSASASVSTPAENAKAKENSTNLDIK